MAENRSGTAEQQCRPQPHRPVERTIRDGVDAVQNRRPLAGLHHVLNLPGRDTQSAQLPGRDEAVLIVENALEFGPEVDRRSRHGRDGAHGDRQDSPETGRIQLTCG